MSRLGISFADVSVAADDLVEATDISFSEDDDRTPLHWAVNKFSMNINRYNFVPFLIDHGADINKGDNWNISIAITSKYKYIYYTKNVFQDRH